MSTTRNANNFDIIRILFAWLVIISHSYVLLGNAGCDWLCEFTNHYINFSYFGVKGFITISGFLIFKSLQRSPNVLDYLWKRVLRIYPGLIVVLLLSVGMAYLIYQPGNTYFKFNDEAINYIFNNLTLYHNQWRIHGVFDKLPNTAINGSLWTMGFEFFFYLVLLCLFPIRNWRKLLIPLLLICIVVLLYGNLQYINQLKTVDFKLRVDLIFELGAFFMTGALLSTLNWNTLPYKNSLALLAGIALISIISLKLNPIWLCIVWPYLVLYIGQGSSTLANWIHQNIEDPSYGIYLYAFPVQQCIIYFFNPNVFVLLWSSTIISFALGIASWKWVEKKMLRFKDICNPHK
jgi:peptidoglycan/LPS O-acetylase OafA/YrhL